MAVTGVDWDTFCLVQLLYEYSIWACVESFSSFNVQGPIKLTKMTKLSHIRMWWTSQLMIPYSQLKQIKQQFKLGLIDVKIQQMLNRIQVLSLKLIALSLLHNYEAQVCFRIFNTDTWASSGARWETEAPHGSHRHYFKLM